MDSIGKFIDMYEVRSVVIDNCRLSISKDVTDALGYSREGGQRFVTRNCPDARRMDKSEMLATGMPEVGNTPYNRVLTDSEVALLISKATTKARQSVIYELLT